MSASSNSFKNWTNQDLLNWVQTISLGDKWAETMTEKIKSTGCTGKDWLGIKNHKQLGKKFNINNTMLANKVFRAFKKVRPQDNISDDQQQEQKVNNNNNESDADKNATNCPGKHGLKQFKTPESGYGCDGCKLANIPIGTTMYGCRICDYDLCSDDYNGIEPKQKHPKCICGVFLTKRVIETLYTGQGVICNKCGQQSDEGFVYHCSKEKNDTHSKGYDLCETCCYQFSVGQEVECMDGNDQEWYDAKIKKIEQDKVLVAWLKRNEIDQWVIAQHYDIRIRDHDTKKPFRL
eukprot:508723_1